MKILNQKEYKEYRKNLSDQGYSHVETTLNMPTDKTFNILEKVFGSMPWDLLKSPVKD
jgi:hypothetical protein